MGEEHLKGSWVASLPDCYCQVGSLSMDWLAIKVVGDTVMEERYLEIHVEGTESHEVLLKRVIQHEGEVGRESIL